MSENTIHSYPTSYGNVSVCSDCGQLLASSLADKHICPAAT